MAKVKGVVTVGTGRNWTFGTAGASALISRRREKSDSGKMAKNLRVIHFLNQFFGGIGGERCGQHPGTGERRRHRAGAGSSAGRQQLRDRVARIARKRSVGREPAGQLELPFATLHGPAR